MAQCHRQSSENRASGEIRMSGKQLKFCQVTVYLCLEPICGGRERLHCIASRAIGTVVEGGGGVEKKNESHTCSLCANKYITVFLTAAKEEIRGEGQEKNELLASSVPQADDMVYRSRKQKKKFLVGLILWKYFPIIWKKKSLDFSNGILFE